MFERQASDLEAAAHPALDSLTARVCSGCVYAEMYSLCTCTSCYFFVVVVFLLL